jgi:hypothetical protein
LVVNAETWGDAFGCVRGVVAFLPLLLAPGYCVAWATDLHGFRGRSLGERLTWSVALSFGLTTIAAVELAKYVSLSAVCRVSAFCALAFAGLLITGLWRRRSGGKWNRAAIWLVTAWIVFVVIELVDVGAGNKLYLSVTVYDHALRTAFVESVLRTGVPPVNPLFWPGHPAPMRYYYFWYVLTAAAARLGHVTARQAMIASVTWAGLGLGAMVTLYCRHFLDAGRGDGTLLRKRWSRVALAFGLLAITGLDILPVIAKAMAHMPTDPDMEWWAPDQVTSWIDSVLWVPHHIAGLVCCLFAFLLVWMSKNLSVAQRTGCGVIAGLAFASAFGLSTWVAVAFAMVMLTWMLWVVWLEPASRPRVPVLLGAALVATLALAPYLVELRTAPSSATAPPVAVRSIADNARGLLRLGVRHLIDPEPLLSLPGVSTFARSYPRTEDAVAGLILLLPGYFLELGVYGAVLVVAFLAWRRSGLDEAARTSVVLASASLLASTLLRSTVIQNNDFGFRSILIAQFFLLLLAVLWCEGAFGEMNPRLHLAMQAMLWLGLAGSVYQVIELRLYLPIEDALGRGNASGLAERAMVWRRGFELMDQRIPANAVVQFNTDQPSQTFQFPPILLVGRQTASAYDECLAAFGGDPAACSGVTAGVTRLYAGQERGGEVRDECHRLGVQYLVATRWDGVWFDPEGWVWMFPAVVHTGDMRVVDCVTTFH